MILWLDDVRKPPSKPKWVENCGWCDYVWCRSVNEVIDKIREIESYSEEEDYLGPFIDGIDCDHDLGDYAKDGGDGIKLLDWLEERGLSYRIRLHTMNPVGRANMQAVIERNKWRTF